MGSDQRDLQRPLPLHVGLSLAAVAVVLLAAGALLYLAIRPPGTAALVPSGWFLHAAGSAWDINGSGWLPSLLHPWAFGLMSASLLSGRRARFAVCLAWGVVDALFELGQHPALASALAERLDAWAGPAASGLGRYFLLGTFDGADLVAAAAGTLAACACLVVADHLRPLEHRRV